MNLKIHKKSLLKVLIMVLIMYTIIFPADKLNIKEILLFITLFFGYFGKKVHFSFKLCIFGVLFPSITIVYSLFRGTSFLDALSYGYVWLFLLLIPIIIDNRFDIKKPFIYSTYIIAIIIDFIMLTDLLGIIPINENFVASFFMNMKELQGLGKGIVATFGYSIFYKSCPLILISLAYFIYNKKIIISIPLIISLLASGTRANFIATLIICFMIPVTCFNNKKRLYIIPILIIIAIYYFPIAFDKILVLNSLKYNGSELTKINDTILVLSAIHDNVLNLLFGTGVGSSFLSSRGYYMSTFEFSVVDYLRQTGIIGLGCFGYFIYSIFKKLMENKEKWLVISFACYLAVACTNPLLVTSTSFMLYVFVISYSNNIKNKVKEGVKNA